MKKFIPLLFVLVLLACNNNNSSKKVDKNTIEEEEIPYVDPVQQEISSAFPPAYQFFSARDSSFDASKFQQMSSQKINNPDLKLSETLKSYDPLFIFNADSSYAIDLYSYNYILQRRNGETVVNHAGPDVEAALIDLKNKTRKRIYFGGSSSALLDAKWTTKDEFFLLMGEIIEQSKFQPRILQYRLQDSSANEFVYTDTLRLSVEDYEDRRLKNLNQNQPRFLKAHSIQMGISNINATAM